MNQENNLTNLAMQESNVNQPPPSTTACAWRRVRPQAEWHRQEARPPCQGSLHSQGTPRRVREELENRKGAVEKGLYTFSSITR